MQGPTLRQPAGYPPPAQPAVRDLVRAVAELPAALQPAFAGMFRRGRAVQGHARVQVTPGRCSGLQSAPTTCRYFNTVQSEAFPAAFQSDSNLVVAAPTGSGKTGVMELAILRLVARQIDHQGQLHVRAGTFKAIYLAPTRALVQVRTRVWLVSAL